MGLIPCCSNHQCDTFHKISPLRVLWDKFSLPLDLPGDTNTVVIGFSISTLFSKKYPLFFVSPSRTSLNFPFVKPFCKLDMKEKGNRTTAEQESTTSFLSAAFLFPAVPLTVLDHEDKLWRRHNLCFWLWTDRKPSAISYRMHCCNNGRLLVWAGSFSQWV